MTSLVYMQQYAMPHIDDTVREMFDNCTASRVRMVARSVSAIYDQAMARHDVTMAQLNLLVVLADFGLSNYRRVGEFLHLDRSTVSRNMDLLMQKELVAAVSSDAKGVREVEITRKGRAKIAETLPDWRLAQAETAKLLGRDGVTAVHGAAATIWS